MTKGSKKTAPKAGTTLTLPLKKTPAASPATPIKYELKANAFILGEDEVRRAREDGIRRGRQRKQPMRDRAKAALTALYPNRTPSEDELSHSDLVAAVEDYCYEQGMSAKDIPSDDTILRAAGRA
jgi:hypothetical protein